MVLSTGFNKIKTAVFISGTGSNLYYLIKFSKIKKSPISINLIISNNSKSKGLSFGKKLLKSIKRLKLQTVCYKKFVLKYFYFRLD